MILHENMLMLTSVQQATQYASKLINIDAIKAAVCFDKEYNRHSGDWPLRRIFNYILNCRTALCSCSANLASS